MFLTNLALSDFRNYVELNFQPQPGLNAFVGANAQGKSNLLEGIAMIGTGKSFRTARDADTVRDGCERAVVRGDVSVGRTSLELTCSVARGHAGTRKSYTVNGHAVRYANYLGKIRVVTFVPNDLQLAYGPPAARRAFLNVALAQTDSRYYYELARYRKALQQKNAVLRGMAGDAGLVDIYDGELVDAGAEIVLARDAFVHAVAAVARESHAQFAPGETLEMIYDPDVAFETAEREAVRAVLRARAEAVAEAERLRKTTLSGPHRDDFKLRLNAASLATNGSQGQQRTAVLALKIAEYAVMRERCNDAPLLLLDDVLSELDDERAMAFLSGIGGYEQVFITATSASQGLPPRTHRFDIHAGRVGVVTAC